LHLSFAFHRKRLRESESVQMLMLIGAVLLGLAAALGTSSLVLSLLFRIMSKLR